jgi:hypothetical protein
MDSRIWCPSETISKPRAPTALTPIHSCSSARSVGSQLFVVALVKRKSLYTKFLRRLINVLGCMKVSLLCSSCWIVSTTDVAIFRVARTRIRPREWPKHVGGYYTIKLHSHTQVHLMVFLKQFNIMINARYMEHIKRRNILGLPKFEADPKDDSKSCNVQIF